jgi:maleate cis-trans isomerase
MAQTKPRAVLIVPANNTTAEPEMTALAPELAPFAVARVPVPPEGVTVENMPTYARSTLTALEEFLPLHPKLVVHGCTAAGFLSGAEGVAEITAALRKRSGAIVTSTAAAMIEVLRSEGVRETAVATPYLAPVNDGLRAYLASAGIAVEVLNSLFCPDVDSLGRVTETEVRDLAFRTVTPRSKALFIACSQLPTRGILEELRRRLGIPVWSSISATAWAASRAAAAPERAAE